MQCNKIFKKQLTNSKKYWSVKKFCSSSCSALNQSKNNEHPFQVKVFSLETRQKMSLAKIGKDKGGKISLFCKECMGIFIAKRSGEAKFCSQKCASDNRNYGKTLENEKVRKSAAYKAWRTLVFERDNYTCVECNVRGGMLHADHIKPFALYSELRFIVGNGRTLCVSCHKKTPTYGRSKIYRSLAVNNGF